MHFDMGNMGYMLIGNPNLEPEKSNNFNLALERQHRIRESGIIDGIYSFTVVGYCNVFDKRITTMDYQLSTLNPQLSTVSMPGALYVNEDGITVWGVDVNLGHAFDWGLTLKLNYSWMHENGNTFFSQFNQPRNHSMTWRVGYNHRFAPFYAFDAALSGRWMGKPQSGRSDVDQGYTIWKLMLQHHLWRGIHLNTAIDNIFNFKPKAYYYSSPPTTGTSFSVGLSVDIDQLSFQ